MFEFAEWDLPDWATVTTSIIQYAIWGWFIWGRQRKTTAGAVEEEDV